MEWYILFIILFIPNVMRQLVYLKSYKKSRSFGFCVSAETIAMHEKGLLPWLGILEEVGWGALWTVFWYLGWQWLAYGWVSDALLDCSIAYAWSKGRKTPKILFYGTRGCYWIREVILPYLLIGPLLFLLGLDIALYCVITTIIGIVLLVNYGLLCDS